MMSSATADFALISRVVLRPITVSLIVCIAFVTMPVSAYPLALGAAFVAWHLLASTTHVEAVFFTPGLRFIAQQTIIASVLMPFIVLLSDQKLSSFHVASLAAVPAIVSYLVPLSINKLRAAWPRVTRKTARVEPYYLPILVVLAAVWISP